MAGEGAGNMIARRVTDDLISFSGETAPSKYMKLFLEQKVAESHRFVNRMRAEVATSTDCIAQLIVVIAEFEAMENQDEVHDSLLAVKDAKRVEHAKLEALNEVIAEALDEIKTQETNVEIFDGDGDGSSPLYQILVRDDVRVENAKLMGLNELVTQAEEEIEMKEAQLECWEFGKGDIETGHRLKALICSYLYLSEVAESSRLADKMKVSLSKKRMLVAELEAVGEVEGVAKSFEHMRVVVARDAVTLGELETLLARAQVGVTLKAGFVADMEVKD
ncbi:hypothetical protein Tco_1500273 [Tanacetum coccineum]